MDPNRNDDVKPMQQEFGQMPGVNNNLVGPSFREMTPADTTKRGMLWSSIGVGALLMVTGIYFLGSWLRWF